MKKIYTLASAVLFTAVTFAQSGVKSPVSSQNRAIIDAKTKAFMASKSQFNNKKVSAAGPFDLDIDPMEQLMTQKGIDLISTTPQEDIFITGLYQDSTVMFSSSTGGTRPIDDIYLGTVVDPRSAFLDPSFDPIVSKVDSYTFDSLIILGSYIKKTPATDTLYAYVVWGDSTNTSVFTKMNTSSVWVSPISTWRKSVIGPKVTGAVGAQGNKVKAAAPSTNMVLIKHVLKPEDSVSTAGRIRLIHIGLSAPITIPANSMISAFYTFVPGAVNAIGACAYSLGGATTQTVNGFAAAIWSQSSPAPTTVNDYLPYQVDNTTMTMGTSYDKKQRHAQYSATFNNNILGTPQSAPVMYYSIQGNSTVGINELEADGKAILGQNIPNPFTSESAVAYQLNKEANTASFTVTDVMGRVISSEKVATTTGKHSVKLASYSAGVYYYTLTVDGKSATKKMIVQ